MKRILSLAFAAGLLLGAAPDAEAQTQNIDRRGTAAMEELLVPVTPRSVSLGAALTSGISGMNAVEAFQANPAGALVGTSTSAMFSRSNYIADVGINYAGVSQRFGANAVTLSLTAWNYGDIPLTTTDAPEINQDITYTASSYVAAVGYAHQFTDRIGAGLTVKGLGRSIANVNSAGFAADAGITYVVPESGLRFGVSLQNIGPSMDFRGRGLARDIDASGPGGGGTIGGEIDDIAGELPVVLTAGGAYTRRMSADLSLTGLATFRSNSFDNDQYAAGLEVGFQNLAFVRGGINISDNGNDTSMWQIWNIGAGVNLPLGGTQIKVDYAYRPTNVFNGVNMFSIGVDL